MPTFKLTKKKVHSHILVHVFCLHFFRIQHNYLFRRGFEKVRGIIIFLSGKKANSTVNLPAQLRFI